MIDESLRARLRVNTPLHRDVADRLKRRIDYSRQKMSNYYKQMADAEDRYVAYLPESELDATRRRQREVAGKMSYRTIEIPYSYATLMAAHTYLSTVFLSRSPVFQFAGRHGESEQQTQAIEAMMDYQAIVGEMLVPLYVWLLDPGKYSFGIVGHYWDKEVVRTRQTVVEPRTFLGLPIPGSARPVTKVVEQIGYQGNRLYNVRPQDWFSDPRVSLAHFQKGEFCGRYVEIPWHEVKEGEQTGRFFNIDVLQTMLRTGTSLSSFGIDTRDTGGQSTDLPGEDIVDWESASEGIPPYVKGYEVVVRLVPRDWKLATEDMPELWVFTVTTNNLIIEATPLAEANKKFPFDILQYEPEGYNFFSNSLMSRLMPLNDILSWLFNVHMYNVRSAINNQFVVDPSMIVMKDLENPAAGKYIRLKPVAYGRDVRMALSQLQVMDVTRGHVGDSQVVMDMLQRVSGINDQIMGMVQGSGRRTATEIRTSTSFGVNRLKTVCEFMSAMGFAPMSQKLVQRTQLNYDGNLKLKLVGDLALFSPTVLQVNPALVAGFYDFVPVDGSLPVDRFAQVTMWNNLMQTMGKTPQLLMQYDIGKIFAWVANLGGVRNLQQMKIVVRPDDMMQNAAQAGNVIPLKPPGASGAPPPSGMPQEAPPMQSGIGAV